MACVCTYVNDVHIAIMLCSEKRTGTVFVCVSFSEHYHVFVGDVSPDIESHQLREAFAPFGQISSVSFLRLY